MNKRNQPPLNESEN
jgi:hypothetical protein